MFILLRDLAPVSQLMCGPMKSFISLSKNTVLTLERTGLWHEERLGCLGVPRHVPDFQEKLQARILNYRQESFNVFLKSGLCPVSSNWKAKAETSPTMAVEIHKHHKYWSRTWEPPGKIQTLQIFPASEYFQMATLGRELKPLLLLKPEKNSVLLNSGEWRKNLLQFTSQ